MGYPEAQLNFGAVAIGRNEGGRLERCIASLSGASCVVYVDSGSNDGSANLARGLGAEVVELETNVPFTAARARNAGLKHLKERAPGLQYVQLIDGDCELDSAWPKSAMLFLDVHPDVAIVFGQLREFNPKASVYNWLCDREWNGAIGDVSWSGGIVMARLNVLEAVGGYREDLIAGEEPELCIRVRNASWRIWRLENKMATHDAALLRFGQWWKRSIRAGYTYGQWVSLYGASQPYFVWQSRRAWLWGLWLPIVCLISGLVFGPWGWAASLIYPVQIARQTFRNDGSLGARATLAIFQTLVRFPEVWGQIRFAIDRFVERRPQLIEYK